MDDYIGRYVKAFESGNKGSLNLSHCGNDYGLSCGSYQLTLRFGNCIKFLKKYFPTQSEELYFNDKPDIRSAEYPGPEYCSSPSDVSKVWWECYESVHRNRFFALEHKYILDNYYEPLMKKLNGLLNPNDHSRALQECLFSYAIHKGPSGAYSGLKDIPDYKSFQNMDVEIILNKIYDYRYNVNKFNRYSDMHGSERDTLLSIKTLEPLPYNGTNRSTGLSTGIVIEVPFICRTTCNTVDIRQGPSDRYDIVGRIITGPKYTIVDVCNNWGKLRSNLGWIPLNHITKVDS